MKVFKIVTALALIYFSQQAEALEVRILNPKDLDGSRLRSFQSTMKEIHIGFYGNTKSENSSGPLVRVTNYEKLDCILDEDFARSVGMSFVEIIQALKVKGVTLDCVAGSEGKPDIGKAIYMNVLVN